MLLGAFFSLACSAQIKGSLKLVTKLSDLSTNKLYVVAAVVDGKMYVMQAKNDGNNKRLCVENITDNPSLFDEDNIFKMTGIKHNSKSSECSSFSSKIGTIIYHRNHDELSIKYISNFEKPFYFLQDDKFDGVLMGTVRDALYTICLGTNLNYCKGYNGTNGNRTMMLYVYDESGASDVQVGSVEIKTTEGYATYYNSKSFVIPSGLVGAIVKNADKESGELALDWKYTTGDVISGSTALLLHGSQGTYALYAPMTEAGETSTQASILSTDTENLLRGSDEDTETVGAEEGVPYYYYKLSYITDVESDKKQLGFYWGATSGSAFINKANHAYLALKQSASFQVKGFQLPAFSDVTGISLPLVQSMDKVDARQGIYTLGGVALPVKDVQSLPAGIYIVNGQKYIKK